MSNKTIGGSATSTSTPLPVAGTIDGTNDYLAIYTASATATQAINRATLLGISGQPADISSSQTLTNKIIGITNTLTALDSTFIIQDDADSTKKAAFQASAITTGTTRTFTFPDISGTLVTKTSTDTLTNKTLTSPTITGGTLDNAAVTVDSVAGHTVAGTGTIYGIGIAAAAFTTSNIINTAALQNQIVTPNKLSTGATAAYVAAGESTASAAYTDLTTTTDSVTVTVGANGLLFLSMYSAITNSGANTSFVSFALSGANTLAASDVYCLTNVGTNGPSYGASHLLSGLAAGSTTIKLKYKVSAGTGTFTNRRLAVVPL